MGDSDDDYDRRKGRDKFRRERNDYDRRDDHRRRDNWEDRRGMRGSYRQSVRSREILNNSRYNRDRRDMYGPRDNYDNRRRDRFSPQRHDMGGGPFKRMRRDWDDSYHNYDMPYGGGRGGHGHMHMGGGRNPWGHGAGPDVGNLPPHQDFTVRVTGPQRPDPDHPTQPPMMTFKQFLSKAEDSIGEEEAIEKYNNYKLDFKRQQISEFFLQHKEEEWFKSKYHPEEHSKRQEEIRQSLQNRLGVFQWLRECGRLADLQLDVDKSESILKILDAAVIRMEGGTDLDLTILDMPPEMMEEGNRSRTTSENAPTTEKAAPDDDEQKEEGEIDTPKKDEKDKEEEKVKEKEPATDKPLEMAITAEQEELQKKAQEYKQQQLKQQQQQKRQRKRKKANRDKSEYSYESQSESESGSDSDMEPAPPGVEEEPTPPAMETGEVPATTNGVSDSKEGTPKKEGSPKKDEETDKKNKEEGKEEGEEEEKDVNTKPEEEETPTKPRPLHRTNSIFLRNLAPTITKQEVEALCKRYPGFMRVALQDPLPERRFFRRGWATFSKSVNIKDICWNLNNIRLRDCELGATLNRDLKVRVRPVNGLTVHKTVARNDIRLAARVIQTLDNKWGLWVDQEEEKKDEEKEALFSFMSKNPVLHNITDYLVEEGSYEEEELLGTSEEDKDSNNTVMVERDPSMLKVLDRMVLYLRLVHSMDYYTGNEYPNEDEMPHRCGIMHARGVPPGTSAHITSSDVTEYMNHFEDKIKPVMESASSLKDEDAARLGRKNPDTEVEKFVQANTQELAKDKWLCPLSGKKFKGPDFVRKHIFNKHAEKVEEVKKEVVFFNNYLLDPKRPSLPEHPASRPPPPPPKEPPQPPPTQQPASGMTGFAGRNPNMMYGGNMPGFGGPGFTGHDGRDFPRRGRPFSGRRGDPRPIIEYRDLDAPDEMDIF